MGLLAVGCLLLDQLLVYLFQLLHPQLQGCTLLLLPRVEDVLLQLRQFAVLLQLDLHQLLVGVGWSGGRFVGSGLGEGREGLGVLRFVLDCLGGGGSTT